jgi:membrane-bound lytic murein transglycosylase D
MPVSPPVPQKDESIPGGHTVTPQPASPSSMPDDEGELTVHTVKKGETMTSIAQQYKVSVEQILKWNLLKSISVKPGQELYVYTKKK